ncbi:unnamed protein product [Mucor hiemalis]
MRLITSIATILSLISVIQAQTTSNSTTSGQSTEAYPAGGAKPVPKPEWLELIKNANITNAPVLKSNGANGPSTSGADNYCDWAKSGCMGSSIGDCPKGQWGLTFDDGPSDVSPILYDFLKTTNQKATLFMIGANVIKYPATVKRAYDEGHELAIHTWTHSYMTTLSNEQIVAELKWTELAIKEITGASPRLFRPPYGDIDNRVRDIGTALGFTSVIWDHDTNDWMVKLFVASILRLHVCIFKLTKNLFSYCSLLKRPLGFNLNGSMVTSLNGLLKPILLPLVVFP